MGLSKNGEHPQHSNCNVGLDRAKTFPPNHGASFFRENKNIFADESIHFLWVKPPLWWVKLPPFVGPWFCWWKPAQFSFPQKGAQTWPKSYSFHATGCWMGCWGLLGWLLIVMMDHSPIPYMERTSLWHRWPQGSTKSWKNCRPSAASWRTWMRIASMDAWARHGTDGLFTLGFRVISWDIMMV